MLNVLRTLMMGSAARAEEAVTDHFAIDLIAQKIREAEQGLEGAKNTLAALIQRKRAETQVLERVTSRVNDLEKRVRLALADGREDLATEGAKALAELENEQAVRKDTLAQLAQRIERTHASVEKANRRIVDLRQGMISARAVDAEQRAQKNLNRSIGNTTAIREAEALIARVVGQPDALEQTEILDEIDAGLDGTAVRDRLAAAGYGDKNKVSAEDVLARLKKGTSPSVPPTTPTA